MNRFYSRFELKSFDESTGEFEGIASTPSTDRMGDIVEPKGAQFSLPLPLLWQHRSEEPIGQIISAKVTAAGIAVKGVVMKDLMPRIADAWTMIRAGLVRGLSIRFRIIKSEPIDPKEPWGALRYLKWDWLELSAVTIPANADASIQSIKSCDDQQRAALGTGTVVRLKTPGASGLSSTQGASNMKTIAEQIAGFEAKRQALVTKNDEIMNKAAEEARTLDAAEQEEYDTAAKEMKAIDDHLVRLREHEKAVVAKATPITPAVGASPDAGSNARSGVITMGGNNLPKGTAFTRYAIALARSSGNLMQAAEIAKGWKDSTPEVELVMRAAVAVGNTTDAAWAAPLVVYQNMANEFIELLRPATIVGRVQGFRRVPFNISMARTTAGSTSAWVGEDNPKPVSRMSFETITLGHATIATIVVLTEQLVRFSNPSAEAVVSQDMRDAIAQYMDQQFIDPTVTASAGIRPASVTNGATSHVMTGTTIAAITTDVSTLFADFSNANIDLTTGVFIMHPRTARYLSMLRTTQDIFAFPGITQNGGTFFGIPVVTSNSVPIDTGADTYIVLMNASDILLADEGGITLDVSREASLQIDGAPSDSASTQISLWQKNLVGLRAERMINYRRRRDAAVSVLEDVSY